MEACGRGILRALGCRNDSLPGAFHVGVLGCEGRNFFWRFSAAVGMGFDAKRIAKSCPVTEYVFDKCYTHLPIYGLAPDQLEYMADAVIESVAEMKAGR